MGSNIEGIISGLDVTSIVTAIIEAESEDLTLMQESIATKTNQITVYNAIAAKLLALKSQASSLSKLTTFDAASASVSDEDYVTATVDGKVSQGQYIISIDQLATNHQLASQGFDSEDASIGTGSITIQVGDDSSTTITIDTGNNTLSGLCTAINKASCGVKAAVINDGSSSNAYRLLLTSEDSGAENQISITSSLTGGTLPDFTNSSFDTPEVISFNSSSTSSVSLGTSSSYTGNVNKTYTFTVQGSGTQTIGTDAITIEWSDGTDSGTIEIPSDYTAGTEIVLTGDGADGLTLSFAEGTLTAGDEFQVQAFSPILQAARDAKITLGSTEAGGSPIVVTSSTNTIDDLIPGVSLNLKKTTDSETSQILISTSVDVDAIESKVEEFITAYNSVMESIDEQFEYDEDSTEAGVLFGDSTLRTVQSRIRSALLTKLTDVNGEFSLLTQLGVRHSTLGELYVADSSALRNAIEDNLEDVINFFTNSSSSTNAKISYISSTSDTEIPENGFEVNITSVATHGYLKGTIINDPDGNPIVIDSSNYKLKLKVDGIVSEEIALTQKTYNSFSELVTEIQSKINQDEKIGSRGITVNYVDTGETGYFTLTSSSYGDNSKVQIQAGIDNSAFTVLGLAKGSSVTGTDVEGTINGEEAEGNGQILTGVEGNRYSDGLSLKVELESKDLLTGSGEPEAYITLIKGFATQLDELIDIYSATGDGVIASRTNALQSQIDSIESDIEDEEERLKIRQDSLYEQYYALEEVLAEWNSTATYLETQFSNLSSNWTFGNDS